MATYLLLRNNRETGPLTKEQILALGLKPYDLIWVEGRSAAWRYANEIPELKDYSPTVEEQPYDRFYKKNTPDPVKEFVETTVKRHAEEPVKKYVQENFGQYAQEQVKEIPAAPIKKFVEEEPAKVYREPAVNKEIEIAVTEGIVQEYIKELKRENGAASKPQPASGGQEELEDLLKKYGNQQTVAKSAVAEEAMSYDDEGREDNSGASINEVLGKQLTKGSNGSVSVIMPKQHGAAKKEEIVVKKVSVTERQEAPVIKKISVPIPDDEIEDRAVSMQTKYSTPLDEIKERYVRQLSDRKQASVKRKWIIKTAKRAAIFIAIIGVGVLIGFAIRPGQTNKGQVAENSLQAVQPVSNAGEVKDDTLLNNTSIPEAQTPTTKEVVEVAQSEQKENIQEPARQVDEKQLVEKTVVNPAVIESANGERTKNVRTNNDEAEPVEKRNVVTSDLADQVSVKANDYKERDLGGFRNLQLTVTNDSKVTLESVMVELTYKKYNDDILSTRHIPFQAILPGETLTIKVPDNNRGAKLSYRIIQIDPRDR